jgi:hypothetical protein
LDSFSCLFSLVNELNQERDFETKMALEQSFISLGISHRNESTLFPSHLVKGKLELQWNRFSLLVRPSYYSFRNITFEVRELLN